jgi:hypothetical protein
MGAEFLGAVTWENGSTPAVGTVSATNSFVGTIPTQFGTGNRVGHGGVVALTNGNYVVDSPDWNTGIPFTFKALGAVTWGDGTTGITGTISTANSLVGSFLGDAIGGGEPATDGEGSGVGGITALANGNYVVDSPGWLKQTGAVTWADGTTGVSGTVSAVNSLVGDAPGDSVGGFNGSGGGATALTNGNYVVLSPAKGTATWGDGTTGIKGTISSVNSLGGAGADSSVGVGQVIPLPNGSYVVSVNNGNGNASDTWLDGTNGTTLDGQNTIDAQNSLMGVAGAMPLFGGSAFLATDAFAGMATVGITDPNLLTYALAQGQTINITPGFLTRSLDAGADVTLQSNDDIVVNSPVTVSPTGTAGNLALQAGRSILINASVDTGGSNLALTANDTLADGVINTERDPGDAAIAEESSATINTGVGFLTVDLISSTDKTNNGTGAVSLPSVTGSESLASGSTLGISIDGTTAGDGVTPGTYTQLNLTGALDLNDASLSISHIAATAAGSTFTIVQTTAGVSGTFTGLSQGATVVAADGTQFAISYQGNGGKDVVLTQLNSLSSTSTQVASSQPAGSLFGQAVTFTATVVPTTSGAGVPTGTVQFQVDGSNLGAPVALVSGSAMLTTGALAVGTHTVTVVYSGDSAFDGSSGTLSGGQTVLPPAAVISGTVFQDININGVQDPGEPGVAGVTIFLDLDGTGMPQAGDPTTITDSKGNFQIGVSSPGAYTLRELLYGGVLVDLPAGDSYQVTVTSGATVSGQNFADVPTSIALPLTLPLTSPFPKQGNPDADFVEALYRALLARNADPAGLASWTGLLESGQLSRMGVAHGIRVSPEHFTQEVTDFYLTILNRPPDPVGLQYWVQQLENGVPEEQVAADFLDSKEYLNKGDKYFVDHMYEALLGRSFDPAGEAAWLGQLGDDPTGMRIQPPILTYQQVIHDFLYSQESLKRLVEGYYQIFLGRLADPAGLAAWLALLRRGGAFSTIAEGFVSSDEFFNNAAAEG